MVATKKMGILRVKNTAMGLLFCAAGAKLSGMERNFERHKKKAEKFLHSLGITTNYHPGNPWPTFWFHGREYGHIKEVLPEAFAEFQKQN